VKTIVKVAGALAVAVSCYGVVGAAQAACSAATVSGEYGFSDNGTRSTLTGSVSYNAVRTATFDGKGATSGKGFVSVSGKISGYSIDGKYTVADDCTFTLTATQTYADGTPSNEYKQFGIVVRGGKEIVELQTTGQKNQSGKYQQVSSY
jgi:hypothetical protein